MRAIVEYCAEIGLEQLTLFCLSSENWKRPEGELRRLMNLLEQFLVEERRTILKQGLRFAMIGRRDGLSDGVLTEIDRTVELSRSNSGMRLCLALNYGSRAEITDAARDIAGKVASGQIRPEDVDEQMISDHLYTSGMPDPDLLIRTAGELRISNYLLWQISYAELWVTEKFWPEFRPPDLVEAFHAFAARDRRYGGLKN